MLLAVDVGNTHIVIGVFSDQTLIADWRITTLPEKTADEYAVFISNLFQLEDISTSQIDHAIISSVVPPLTHVMTDYIQKYFCFKPIVLGEQGVNTGIAIHCEYPSEVGADRIVNAVAGIEKFGAPLIIVDFGTATTFDAVSAKGEYQGGAIAPGIVLSMESLCSKTARLPKIDIRRPDSVIGRNTIASMESGAFFGYLGLVDGIIEKMLEEMGSDVMVIATGGLSDLIVPESKFIKAIDPFLTLKGLKIIHQRNRQGSG